MEVPSHKSLYVEMYFQDTLISSGTATLIANDRESHCALITARHNVTGRHHETGECLSKHAAIPDSILIYFHETKDLVGSQWKQVRLPLYRDDGSPCWIEHPRLGANADIVALNLSWGNDVARYPYFLKTDLDSVNLVIGPAETVSVIGFPFGLSRAEKFPLWATGFLAHEMSLVTAENPVFMIDCRTRQGQSGSPVIAFRPSGFRHEKEGKIVTAISANKAWEFLGIYSGRINLESDLGTVWHVRAIGELLFAAESDMEERNRPSPAST